MPTPRYEHRLMILPYAPAFRALEGADQDRLLRRLYSVHDLCELCEDDRAFVRRAALEVANAPDELPGSRIDYHEIDAAMYSGDDDTIERMLDRIGLTREEQSEPDLDQIAQESAEFAERHAEQPAYDLSEFRAGTGAIWHYQKRWSSGPPSEDLGTGPFTVLLVLRVHPDGALDVCRLEDVPPSPEYERAQTGSLPRPETFIGAHTPVQTWLRVEPKRWSIFPYPAFEYPTSEFQKLIARLHLR